MSIQQVVRDFFQANAALRFNWPVETTKRVGDVGRIVDGVFERIADLSHFDLEFDIRSSPKKARGRWARYASSTSIEVSMDGAYERESANASMKVAFGDTAGAYLLLEDASTSEIDNTLELERELLLLSKLGKWKAEYAVVTQVISASSAVLALSFDQQASAVAEFSLAGPKPNTDSDLPEGIRFALSKSKNTSFAEVISDSTPLFRAQGLRRTRLTSKRLQVRAQPAPEHEITSGDTSAYQLVDLEPEQP